MSGSDRTHSCQLYVMRCLLVDLHASNDSTYVVSLVKQVYCFEHRQACVCRPKCELTYLELSPMYFQWILRGIYVSICFFMLLGRSIDQFNFLHSVKYYSQINNFKNICLTVMLRRRNVTQCILLLSITWQPDNNDSCVSKSRIVQQFA